MSTLSAPRSSSSGRKQGTKRSRPTKEEKDQSKLSTTPCFKLPALPTPLVKSEYETKCAPGVSEADSAASRAESKEEEAEEDEDDDETKVKSEDGEKSSDNKRKLNPAPLVQLEPGFDIQLRPLYYINHEIRLLALRQFKGERIEPVNVIKQEENIGALQVQKRPKKDLPIGIEESESEFDTPEGGRAKRIRQYNVHYFMHAGDAGSRLHHAKESTNVARTIGKFSANEKVGMKIPSRKGKPSGQVSNVLTFLGLKKFVEIESYKKADPAYMSWLAGTVLPILARDSTYEDLPDEIKEQQLLHSDQTQEYIITEPVDGNGNGNGNSNGVRIKEEPQVEQ